LSAKKRDFGKNFFADSTPSIATSILEKSILYYMNDVVYCHSSQIGQKE